MEYTKQFIDIVIKRTVTYTSYRDPNKYSLYSYEQSQWIADAAMNKAISHYCDIHNKETYIDDFTHDLNIYLEYFQSMYQSVATSTNFDNFAYRLSIHFANFMFTAPIYKMNKVISKSDALETYDKPPNGWPAVRVEDVCDDTVHNIINAVLIYFKENSRPKWYWKYF